MRRVPGIVGTDVAHLGDEVKDVEGILAEREGVSKTRVVGLNLVAMVIHLGCHLLGTLKGAGQGVVLCNKVVDFLLEVFVLHLVAEVLVIWV